MTPNPMQDASYRRDFSQSVGHSESVKEPCVVPTVSQELSRMSEVMCAFGETIETLEKRLSPVLGHPSPEPCPPNRDQSKLSPDNRVSTQIHRQTEMLILLRTALLRVMERLEV